MANSSPSKTKKRGWLGLDTEMFSSNLKVMDSPHIGLLDQEKDSNRPEAL